MQHTASIVIVVLFILFAIYRRTRSSIGFQKLAGGRMIFRMALFVLIGVLFLVAGSQHPQVYLFDAIGIVVGGVIAYYAIRTTSFERRADAWFYRPNVWIGALLLVLFFGRIGYRVYQDYALVAAHASKGAIAQQSSFASYSHDPLTAIIMFTLVAYYLIYYTFLIRKERHLA